MSKEACLVVLGFVCFYINLSVFDLGKFFGDWLVLCELGKNGGENN